MTTRGKAAAVLFVVAYFASSRFAGLLEPLSRFQAEHGAVGAFLNRAVFCSLLCFRIGLLDRG